MGLTINVKYDSSVNNAPPGFEAAVQAAVLFYEHAFSNNITITIDFGYGEYNGTPIHSSALSESQSTGNYFSYSQIKSALAAHATSADDNAALAAFGVGDPTNGGRFYVPLAEQQALGLLTTTPAIDGYIGLNSAYSFDFDPNARAVPGLYDAVGVLEHEISEVMGRVGSLGQEFGSNVYTPLDLFRYSSAGVRDLTPGPGYFSIDGQTLLTAYNNPANGGDAADWVPGLQGDSYGSGTRSTVDAVSPTDIREDNIIGYTRAAATRDDFTGDDVSDVLWRNNSTGDTGYWVMNGGTATWTAVGLTPTSYSLVGTGDFNGDYTADLLWRNNLTGDTGFYAMPLGGGQATWEDLGTISTAYTIVGAGDFTDGGTAGILWWDSANGDTGFWTMSGGHATAWHELGMTPTAYHVAGVGDFDGNGTSDILWQNNTTGDLGIYLLSTAGQATWQDLASVAFVYSVAGIGDFNDDGTSDILLRNNSNGDIGYWAMNHAALPTWHDLAISPLAYSVIGIGDYSGSGSADILWRDAATGDTGYWAMNGGQATEWRDVGPTSAAYTVPT